MVHVAVGKNHCFNILEVDAKRIGVESGAMFGEAEIEQNAELERLQALAAVNANIRMEEIDYRRQCADELLEHLDHMQLRLDAVRVALAT
jgi:hypothetical protein